MASSRSITQSGKENRSSDSGIQPDPVQFSKNSKERNVYSYPGHRQGSESLQNAFRRPRNRGTARCIESEELPNHGCLNKSIF